MREGIVAGRRGCKGNWAASAREGGDLCKPVAVLAHRFLKAFVAVAVVREADPGLWVGDAHLARAARVVRVLVEAVRPLQRDAKGEKRDDCGARKEDPAEQPHAREHNVGLRLGRQHLIGQDGREVDSYRHLRLRLLLLPFPLRLHLRFPLRLRIRLRLRLRLHLHLRLRPRLHLHLHLRHQVLPSRLRIFGRDSHFVGDRGH